MYPAISIGQKKKRRGNPRRFRFVCYPRVLECEGHVRMEVTTKRVVVTSVSVGVGTQ